MPCVPLLSYLASNILTERPLLRQVAGRIFLENLTPSDFSTEIAQLAYTVVRIQQISTPSVCGAFTPVFL